MGHGALNRFGSYTFFPANSWSHTWERHHEVITRFAELIDDQVYIFAPLGLIEHSLFSVRFFEKLAAWLKGGISGSDNKVLDNMVMVKELYLHRFDRISAVINYAKLRHSVPFTNRNFFWCAYMNPTIYEFFSRSAFTVIDLAQRRQGSTAISQEMKNLERKAVSRANLVIVDNLATYEDYKNDCEYIHYVPQGYDPVLFQRPPLATRDCVGYIGNLHDQIDYNYLCDLIKINRERTFLIVGGKMTDEADRLDRYPNVEMVGQVPKEALQGYLDRMEYGLIPYKVNEFTRGVFPTKLFEYLGAGVPVISTPIAEVINFCNDRFVFVEAEPSPVDRGVDWTGIDSFLAEHSWEARLKKYMEIVCSHLS